MRATLSWFLETNIESCCDKGEAAAEGRGVCILHARGNARMAQPWCGGNFRHTPRKSSHIMHGVSNVYGKASLLCQPCLSVGPLKIAILSTWHSSKPLSHGTFFGMFCMHRNIVRQPYILRVSPVWGCSRSYHWSRFVPLYITAGTPSVVGNRQEKRSSNALKIE